MKENQIVIQKAKVRLYTDSKKTAYDLKDHVSDFLKNVIFPIIEDYVARYEQFNGLESMTVLNRLNLNISINESEYKNSSLKLVIEDTIVKQLDIFFDSSSSEKVGIIQKENRFAGMEFVPGVENKINYSPTELVQNSLIYFLQKGILPWYCNEDVKQHLFTGKLIQELLSENQFFDRFIEVFRNKVTRQRFVLQFDEEVILDVLNILFVRDQLKNNHTYTSFDVLKHPFFLPLSRKDKTDIFINLLNIYYVPNSEEIVHKVLKNTENLISVVDMDKTTIQRMVILFKSQDFYQNPEKINPADFIDKKRSSPAENFTSEKDNSKKNHAVSEEDNTSTQEILDETILPITEKFNDDTVTGISTPVTSEEDSDDLNSEDIIVLTDEVWIEEVRKEEVVPHVHEETSEKREEAISEIEEGVITPESVIETEQIEQTEQPEQVSKKWMVNAGMIIIHPFLKTFFGRLGLLSENSHLQDPELCAHLLHYLATGVEQNYEHQLSFEKLICGIPQEVPIDRFVVLTEEMKKEAEGLLRAVLDNWPILKNSGTELLQNEFLKREGVVHTEDKNIHISFERKVQDILIDKLEWTISFIKLPWLDKVIRVNW